MAMCSRTDCPHKATHHLEARVWATGYPKGAKTGFLTAMIGLPLCKDHALEEADSKVLVTSDFWEALDHAVRQIDGMPANHDTMELNVVRGVPEWFTGSVSLPPSNLH